MYNVWEQLVKYVPTHLDDIGTYILEHIYLVSVSVTIALAAAVILAVICKAFPKAGLVIISVFNITYAIPSLSLLALLMPYFGLGKKTAIICIVIYEQFLLLKNILVGFDSLNPNVIEAAEGMGMSRVQTFFWVKLPLAMPAIVNGLKLASLSAVGMAVIGAFISAGGIGSLIYDGLRRNYTAKVLIGTVLSTSLAVIVNQIFQKIEGMVMTKARGGFILKARKHEED